MWKWDMICSADAELRKERLRTRTLPNQSSRSVSFEAIRYPSISRLLPLALATKHSFGSWRSLRTFCERARKRAREDRLLRPKWPDHYSHLLVASHSQFARACQ